MNSRIDQLNSFYREDPKDPFNLFILALEYKNIDPLKSKELFLTLVNTHPTYLPTYYIFAEMLNDMGEKNFALEIIEKGLTISALEKNIKTTGELKNLKELLLNE